MERNAAAVSGSCFSIPVLMAQTSRPKFEVASIKLSKQDTSNWSYHFPREGIVMENAPIDFVICWAYHIKNFQLTGAPKWLATSRFDINATAGRAIARR